MAKMVLKIANISNFGTVFAIFGLPVHRILTKTYYYVVEEVLSFDLVGHM